MDDIVIIGGGGHALSVIDTLISENKYNIVGILDINKKESLLGIPFLGDDSNLQDVYDNGVRNVVIAIGGIGAFNNRVKVYNIVKEMGFKLPPIIDKTAQIGKGSCIAEGTFIAKGAVVNACSTIGKLSIINSLAVIEHECRIGEFCHIAPGCNLGGSVKVGNFTHIGIGSTIIQGVNIGDRTLIGAGSVVVKDIASCVKAYGNPCRKVGNIEYNNYC
jgi:sugar O-acyltransferase (sialic acid O-acetyltransferase NeuD family)